MEIVGCANGEKRASSSQTYRIVKLLLTPEVGEKLTIGMKSGQVLIARTGLGAEPG